jgi:hypothetical protein
VSYVESLCKMIYQSLLAFRIWSYYKHLERLALPLYPMYHFSNNQISQPNNCQHRVLRTLGLRWKSRIQISLRIFVDQMENTWHRFGTNFGIWLAEPTLLIRSGISVHLIYIEPHNFRQHFIFILKYFLLKYFVFCIFYFVFFILYFILY